MKKKKNTGNCTCLQDNLGTSFLSLKVHFQSKMGLFFLVLISFPIEKHEVEITQQTKGQSNCSPLAGRQIKLCYIQGKKKMKEKKNHYNRSPKGKTGSEDEG